MIRQTRNFQQALCQMSRDSYRMNERYFATYERPVERVPFHPDLNPMVLLLESLTVLSGRQAEPGFAQYGPMLYKTAKPGVSIPLLEQERLNRFTLTVDNGQLNAELMAYSVESLHQLASDAISFSSVQEVVARKHSLQVGHFFHVCDDVSKLEKPGVSFDPYTGEDAVSYPVGEPTMMQHLGMFLDEGIVLGLRDRFLAVVADPMVQTLRSLLSKEPEKVELAWHAISKGDDRADWVIATMMHLKGLTQ